MTRLRPYGNDTPRMSLLDHALALSLAVAVIGSLAWWSFFRDAVIPATPQPPTRTAAPKT